MKQHFQIPWAQILIVCAALVMAFGMGTSVQVEQEAVGQREAFRRSLQMLDQYLCALSEDLGDPDILALEAPLEDDRIQENLVRVRYGHHQRQTDGRPVGHRGGKGHWNAICIGEN